MSRLEFACFLLFLLACCLTASANPTEQSPREPTSASSRFIGRWSPNCEKFAGFNIHGINDIVVEVNANQIYIISHGTLHDNALDMYLDNPADLGRGGMMLSWDFYSRNKVIATMRLSSEESAVVEWFGFYNKSSRSREWVSEPDFAGIGIGSSILSKCND